MRQGLAYTGRKQRERPERMGKKKQNNSIACLRLYCCKPGSLTETHRRKERALETTCGQHNEEGLGSRAPGTGILSVCRMGTQSLSGSLDTGCFVYPGGWCQGAEVFAMGGCASKCL